VTSLRLSGGESDRLVEGVLVEVAVDPHQVGPADEEDGGRDQQPGAADPVGGAVAEGAGITPARAGAAAPPTKRTPL